MTGAGGLRFANQPEADHAVVLQAGPRGGSCVGAQIEWFFEERAAAKDLVRTDHLFIVNKTRNEYFDCSKIPLTYFERLANDVRNRTANAMTFTRAATVTELAIKAQAMASRRGYLK